MIPYSSRPPKSTAMKWNATTALRNLPIAYSELKSSVDRIKLSERYVQENHEMRYTDKQQSAHGDNRSAIKNLRGDHVSAYRTKVCRIVAARLTLKTPAIGASTEGYNTSRIL
jgi:hypothetical protein